MFVSWCANQAGITPTIIPKHASCDVGKVWFKNNGLWQNSKYKGGSYTPKKGDIIYFSNTSNMNDSTHVGIVTGASSTTVHTIEGNSDNKVVSDDYPLGSDYILGYGTPVYDGNTPPPPSSEAAKYTFDSNFYYDSYLDLRNSFGNDKNALYDHWITYGIAEGRCASPYFDLKYYVEYNPDLKAAFGTDYKSAYQHFINIGHTEWRTLPPIYDSGYYSSNYPDLKSTNSIDFLIHFTHHGIYEGRVGSPGFNPIIYRNLYPDLSQAFGDNISFYYWHYMTNGRYEGRVGNDNVNPIIENIEIIDKDKNGYTVRCKVTDNIGVYLVRFPTWTEKDNQDDIIWGEGVKSGDTYSYRVNISDHNNEQGVYHTHIYAHDVSGNITSDQNIKVIIDNDSPQISNIEIVDKDKNGYTVRCKEQIILVYLQLDFLHR